MSNEKIYTVRVVKGYNVLTENVCSGFEATINFAKFQLSAYVDQIFPTIALTENILNSGSDEDTWTLSLNDSDVTAIISYTFKEKLVH